MSTSMPTLDPLRAALEALVGARLAAHALMVACVAGADGSYHAPGCIEIQPLAARGLSSTVSLSHLATSWCPRCEHQLPASLWYWRQVRVDDLQGLCDRLTSVRLRVEAIERAGSDAPDELRLDAFLRAATCLAELVRAHEGGDLGIEARGELITRLERWVGGVLPLLALPPLRSRALAGLAGLLSLSDAAGEEALVAVAGTLPRWAVVHELALSLGELHPASCAEDPHAVRVWRALVSLPAHLLEALDRVPGLHLERLPSPRAPLAHEEIALALWEPGSSEYSSFALCLEVAAGCLHLDAATSSP